MSPTNFWTANPQLHSVLWGLDQWLALQVGQQLECVQVRCTFEELDSAPVANRTLCLRHGAEHSVVRLFQQQQPLGVVDVRFHQVDEPVKDSTPAVAPPFAVIDEHFQKSFPYISTRLIHPQGADIYQVAKKVANCSVALTQLEFSSAPSDYQNADLRVSGQRLNASVWRSANARGAA